MNRVRVNDRLPTYRAKAISVIDGAFKEAAKDGLIAAKDKAPFEKGALRRESDVKRVKPMHWRIRFWEEYARFQEFGGDSKRKVTNYSTPGTGAHFLRDSGDKQHTRLPRLIKKHLMRL